MREPLIQHLVFLRRAQSSPLSHKLFYKSPSVSQVYRNRSLRMRRRTGSNVTSQSLSNASLTDRRMSE
jgi:hypothetical protein